MNFKTRLLTEYPIPAEASIWVGNQIDNVAIKSLDDLIVTCATELSSDIPVTYYKQANGMRTILPEDTITVSSAKLTSAYPFQGNRLIKASYDCGSRVCFLRYFPATLTIRRRFKCEIDTTGAEPKYGDYEILTGAQLQFAKSYVLWKMAEGELSILKAVNPTTDNASVDWSVLENFRNDQRDRYEGYRQEILIYSAAN